MSDNEEERLSCKTIILHGPDNFAQWELSIGTTLLGKGLLDCISTDVPLGLPMKEAAKEKFRYGKAFAVVVQSLSGVVQQSIQYRSLNHLTESETGLGRG